MFGNTVRLSLFQFLGQVMYDILIRIITFLNVGEIKKLYGINCVVKSYNMAKTLVSLQHHSSNIKLYRKLNQRDKILFFRRLKNIPKPIF